MVYGCVAFFAVMWVLLSSASVEHSDSVLVSLWNVLLVCLPLCVVFCIPLLLFWSVNKTALSRILRDGQAFSARERSRERVKVRAWVGVCVTVDYYTPSGMKTALFTVSPSDAPPVGV